MCCLLQKPSLVVEPSFWEKVFQLKLQSWKLSETSHSFNCSADFSDGSAQAVCKIDGAAFEEKSASTVPGLSVLGKIRVLNTMAAFKTIDKQACLEEDAAVAGCAAADAGAAAEQQSRLHMVLSLLCFADLKTQQVTFWSAFAAPPLSCRAQIIEGPAASPITRLPGVCVASPNGLLVPWHVRNELHAIQAAHEAMTTPIVQFENGQCVEFALVQRSTPEAALVGWLPDRKGRLLPRRAKVGAGAHGPALAKQASDLNLSLMKWQAAPGVRLDALAASKVLLLGAGTLGCNVARGLVGWGVSDITFLDYGTVSMSNPTRQPLFTFEDAVARVPKAQAAAAALTAVQPAARVTGHTFSIPMPGHHSTQAKDDVVQQVDKLKAHIAAADVVFLLTDSRESRWLPSLLCCSMGVPLLNVALGFDTCLVMRHGVGGDADQPPSCGCYFCADIVAPTDSSGNRTLDQQCTVTRPALAAWASAMAVELMVNTLHHSEGFAASGNAASGSMGDVPHTLRCDVSTFAVQQLETHTFEHCSACSPAIRQAMRDGGSSLLADMLMDTVSISQLCGLDAYYAQAEAAAAEWQDEDLDWE